MIKAKVPSKTEASNMKLNCDVDFGEIKDVVREASIFGDFCIFKTTYGHGLTTWRMRTPIIDE